MTFETLYFETEAEGFLPTNADGVYESFFAPREGVFQFTFRVRVHACKGDDGLVIAE